MENLDFIKKFTKINLSGICRKKKIDRSNLISGKTTKENEKIIREEIESEIAKLYIKEE